MKLYVATHNQHKIREIGQILPGFEIIADDPEGVEENAPDFEGNALIKVRAIAARHRGAWSMADDSGLEVDALGGAPGIYSARYASLGGDLSVDHNFESNIDRVLHELNTLEFKAMAAGEKPAERTARFRCCVTLMLDGEPHFFDGACEGKIAYERTGNGGFGYDPIFLPDAFPGRSMAELSEDEKNSISHRGQALRLMADWLKSRGVK